MDGLSLIEQALARAGSAAAAPGAGATARPMARLRGTTGAQPRAGADFFVVPTEYTPFGVGALGNFPYYWQIPANLSFNAITYAWVTSGLLPGTTPVQLDGVFTNRFIRVLSTVFYTLSTADQAKLDNAQAAATNEQRALLQEWKSAFGELPVDQAGTPPINLIIQVITGTWASPPTDLDQLLKAEDPLALLNAIPPKGQPVVPVLKTYLTTISSSVPLLNEVTKNNGLLTHALAALQEPTVANGALALSDQKLMPAVSVQTPLSDILAGLASQSVDRTARLSLEVTPGNDGDVDFRVNGSPTSSLPAPQLVSLIRTGGGEQLASVLSASAGPTTITADFGGVTTVSFGPVEFSTAALKGWFWTEPIRQALQNGSLDVTGFKFSPKPPFDLSAGGPFGYVTSVLISRNPTIRVVTAPSKAALLASAFTRNVGAELIFLGRRLGTFGVQGGYSATRDSADNGAITLQPQASASIDTDARAFVLGVKTAFPAG